ncbi:MAG: acyltransferase [Rhizobiales bacterium]|nr:acyltransferase [Hyphomicrobiales bacterium]
MQVLRAIAAASVAVRHAQHDAATLSQQNGHLFQAWNPIPWSAGVDVFFVISGLIMVHASQQLFATPGGSRLFLSRRIARIVPLYWAVTTLYVAVALFAPALLNQTYINASFVFASYFFIPAARPDGIVQPAYELGWTLNYEMFFYVLFAAAICLPLRWAAAALLTVLTTLVIAGRLAAPLAEPLAFWTNPILLEFAFGVVLGVMLAQGVRLSRRARAGLVAAGLAALMLAAAYPELYRVLPRPVVYGLPAALIVAAAALGQNRGQPAGLLARCGAAAGDASYALYLLHPFAIRAIRILFWQTGLVGLLGPSLGPWIFVAVAVPFCLLAALATYYCVEKPLTSRLRRMLGDAGKTSAYRPAVGIPRPQD